jgi:uncharacterized phage infection (PIP) family protein YhgE
MTFQLHDCVTQLKTIRKKEASRVRSNTLRNIDAMHMPLSPPSSHSTRQRSTTKVPEPEGTTGTSEVIQQLRRRTASLEQENRELRLKVDQDAAFRQAVSAMGAEQQAHAHAAETGSTRDAAVTTPRRVSEYLLRESNTLKDQVAFFTAEVARIQQEKDELQKIVTMHPRTVELSDGVNAVVRAVRNGCNSLIAQTNSTTNHSSQTAADTLATRQQHSHAIEELKKAVDGIASRRSTGSSAIPTCATAGDCELMSHYLTFEIERLSHLRAFLPSFAQLCASVERMKISHRSNPSNSF